MSRMTREELLEHLAGAGLDDYDMEDVEHVVDVLLEAFTPLQILTWLYFPDHVLGTSPILLFSEGRGRTVAIRARRMLEDASSS